MDGDPPVPDPTYIATALTVAVTITVALRAIPFALKNAVAESTLLADIGGGPAQLRADIDAAYRTKYGSSGSSSVDAMVAGAAAAATLQLSRE